VRADLVIWLGFLGLNLANLPIRVKAGWTEIVQNQINAKFNTLRAHRSEHHPQRKKTEEASLKLCGAAGSA
jgi:hypothetical protein